MTGAGQQKARGAASRRGAVGLLGLMAACGASSPAVAYTILSEGTVTEVKWQSPTNIPYLINQNGSDNISFTALRPVLVASMATWTLVPDSNLTFVDNGNTAVGHVSGDGLNVITFIESSWPFGAGAIAFAQTRYPLSGPGTDFFTEGDIALNGAEYNFSVNGSAVTTVPAKDTYDAGSIVAHESGHWVGLDHSPSRSATIYHSFQRVGVTGLDGRRSRTLTNDDRAGIQYLYGTGAATGTISGTIDSDINGQGMVVAAINLATGDTITGLCGNRIGLANEAYRIDRLPPGSYHVITLPLDDVNFQGMLPANLQAPFPNVDNTFRPRFYRSADATGTASRALASTVVVTAGGTTANINIDPPDAAVSQNIYFTTAVASSFSSPQGPTLASGTEGIRYGYSTVANTPGLLGPAANTLGAGSFLATFGTTGIGGESVSVYQATSNITAGARGSMLTLYVEHSAGQVDFLPGCIEIDFDPLGRPDSDGDGVLDVDETADQSQIAFTSATNVLMADTDGDGLNDGTERLYATDPRDTDTDNDGIPDGVEARFGWDPLSSATPSPATDTDGDGLPDYIESRTTTQGGTGTNPNNADSDSDGFSDGFEIARGRNPSSSASIPSLGDPNNDNSVPNAADVATIVAWIANGGTLADHNAADIDGNGVINAADVTMLSNWIGGQIAILR